MGVRMAAEPDELSTPSGLDQEVDGAELAALRRRPLWSRWAWTTAGIVALAAGVIGVVMPVMPTTPFLLLATACFLRGSERMHRWMLTNRWFGEYLRRYREGRGIPVRTKIGAVAFLWAGIGVSATFFVESWLVRVVMFVVAVAVSVHIAMIGRRR